MKALIFLALPLTIATAAAQEAARNWRQDPASGCRFQAPASLTQGPTAWVGTCRDGRAEGLGMLRRRDGAQAGAAFFGEMREGVPRLGVVEAEGGYRVGAFAQGDIGTASELEWQERLDAFRLAAQAARMVSDHYARAGNAASSRFYQSVAAQLEQQVE
ncbi:hypothetical protein IAI18_05740 [Acetobacteraceae bacterium H6797]|nr:hypothetical protein [Acetobacteraceae bacterium H6797]